MFDILAYLIEQYFSPEDCPDQVTLAKQLAAVGFDDQDIDEALDWLRELTELDPSAYAALQCMPDAARVLHPREAERLTPEAQAFFLYLASTHALTFGQREQVLDRLMQSGNQRIDAEAIKRVALMVLWRQGDDIANLLIEELLYTDGDAAMH